MRYLIIAVLVLVALGSPFVVIKIRRSLQKSRQLRKEREAKAERRSAIDAWFTRAQNLQHDYKKLAQIEDPPDITEFSGYSGYLDSWNMRISEARAKIAAAEEKCRQDGLEAQRLMGEIVNATGTIEKFEAAHAIRDDYDLRRQMEEKDVEFVATTVKALVNDYVETLLALARGGDRISFVKLTAFTTGRNSWQKYEAVTSKPYVSPADWDDLVVKFHKNPSLESFRFVNIEQDPGAVRLMAARALKDRSLKEAQIVLAFCNVRDWFKTGHQSSHQYWPWRGEIGDVLLADLTKMVHELQIEQNCTFTSVSAEV